MIISASYKTDIPTFYGEWFINRLRAGFCKTVNSYNKHVIQVSLRPENVNGIVFWTKNIGPFLKHLPVVQAIGIPFVIQHTINGYPRILEHSVVDSATSVENVRRVVDCYGQKTCVWRYDTVLMTSLTDLDFHLATFSALAKKLEGSTDEVVVSFGHIYKKTLRNMDISAKENGFTWRDPDDEWKRNLISQLVEIASAHRMSLTICSQPQYVVSGCGEARCIDSSRLEAVGGKYVTPTEKGNRPDCRCSEARDIGEYDTCPHGCVYCYAVQNRPLALERYHQHDPLSEFLFPPPHDAIESKASSQRVELTLFDQLTD